MYQDGNLDHKVGYKHHYGIILADALKSDKSGHTVSMYEELDESGYSIIEWDQSGQVPIKEAYADTREEADILYIWLAFGINV